MSKIRILIAEDDKSIRELYDKGLVDDMFEKRFAENGKEALEAFQEWKPDLLVLDIVMPVMTGFIVLQEIRNTLKDTITPIVMATSMSDPQDVRDCVKFGIQGYIVKPFKFKEIGNRIMHCVQKD